MERRATCAGTWQVHWEGIRKGRSYIIHFFLQLRKQAWAQRGEANCPRSHSLERGRGPRQAWPTCALTTVLSGLKSAPTSPFPGLGGPRAFESRLGATEAGGKARAERKGLTGFAALGRPPGEAANGRAPR